MVGQVEGVACVDGRNSNQTIPALETEIIKVTFRGGSRISKGVVLF